MTDDEEHAAIHAFLAAHATAQITRTFSAMDWLVIVGNIDLALKHPENTTGSSIIARRTATVILDDLIALGLSPELVEHAYGALRIR